MLNPDQKAALERLEMEMKASEERTKARRGALASLGLAGPVLIGAILAITVDWRVGVVFLLLSWLIGLFAAVGVAVVRGRSGG